MERVIIESPFAGKAENEEEADRQTYRHMQYLRACMKDCLQNDEAPYASHGLYTQPNVLDDKIPEERERGILAGFKWGECGARRKFYVDCGMSSGMKWGMKAAEELGQPIDVVKLGDDWEQTSGGVVVSPALAAELRHALRELDRNKQPDHVNAEYMDGYRDGLRDARMVVSGKVLKTTEE